jgi:hypothetical protein
MSDKISNESVINTVPVAVATAVVAATTSEDGIIKSFFRKMYSSKMYIFITVVVIAIGLVLYYFYTKKYMKNKSSKQEQPPFPEYYVLDNNGMPVKAFANMANLPITVQQPSQQEIAMLQNQMLGANNQHKLEHPSNVSEHNEYTNELEKINSNENENIRMHNLTASELNEIDKKLGIMNN